MNTPSAPQQLDVVVVGAGIAGLGAAAALQSDGARVRVVEARDRLGGRIHTSRAWPTIPVDLGASWIHGSRNNPLSELARDLNLDTRVTRYRNCVTFDVDGKPLGPDGEAFLNRIDNLLKEILDEQLQHWSSTDEPLPPGSVADALSLKLDPQTLSESERRWFYTAANQWEHEYGADLEVLDRRTGFLHAGGFHGPDRLFPGGFHELVCGVAQGLDITLSCPVQRIRWNDRGVALDTPHGRIDAKQVIVTLPLGVLQAETVRFDPPLPQAKLTAIQSLGSGLLNKCALQFAHCFWDPEAEFIVHVDRDRGRWLEFLNLYPYNGSPVLIGLNSGAFAEHLERRPDLAVVGSAMDVLRAIYGQATPEPEAWQTTSWGSDPDSLGSYSFHAVGSGPEARQALAEPLGNRVFFAGEATADVGYQTVHGALLSGLREADRLLAGPNNLY